MISFVSICCWINSVDDPCFLSDSCTQVCPASPVVRAGVMMLRHTYVAAAPRAGTLPLRLASAIAPAWLDLRAPLITWVGVVAVETPTGVIGLHCAHAHAPHHSLKIEGWPEQPLSLNIDLYLLVKMKEGRIGVLHRCERQAFILDKAWWLRWCISSRSLAWFFPKAWGTFNVQIASLAVRLKTSGTPGGEPGVSPRGHTPSATDETRSLIWCVHQMGRHWVRLMGDSTGKWLLICICLMPGWGQARSAVCWGTSTSPSFCFSFYFCFSAS